MKRMKKLLCLLLAGTMLLSAAGCGKTDKQPDAAAEQDKTEDVQPEQEVAYTHTVTDHNGNEVEVPKEVNRIVVCDILPLPSVLSVFFDSAEKIVGIPGASMSAAQNGLLGELYPEILDAKTDFIDGTTVNMEEMMNLAPDVVFYSSDSEELGGKLREAGFAAIAVSASKWEYNAIETLNQWVALLGEIFPQNDKLEKVQAYSEDVYQLVKERTADIPEEEKEKVFFLFQYNDTMLMTSGKNFFGQWWADSVGAVNVAQELTKDKAVPVNMEQIYEWNPSLIFITNFTPATPEAVYKNEIGTYDWSAVEAVQKERVYKMPLGIYRSYTAGADTPVTLLWLAQVTYPELFEDIDIVEETKAYYQEVFGIKLTDEQAGSIFQPAAEAAGGAEKF